MVKSKKKGTVMAETDFDIPTLREILNDGDKNFIENDEETSEETQKLNEDQIEIILKHVEKNILKAQESSQLAGKMFEEVKKISQLKITEAGVPKGILPSEYSVALYDVRITGYGPDEAVYRKHKWIRDNVTRGMTFMRVTGKEKYLDFAIYANKKFTGGVGDEDDYQPESNDVWLEFCLDPPEEADEVICMTKLNGEAGHFTVRCIGGEYYIIAGSKNVHLLFRSYEDIYKYTDSRYLVARTVAKSVLDTFVGMDEKKLACFKKLLCDTKMTVVCELLQPDYQHIVDLSHLARSDVNLLMLASVASEEVDSFTAMPPHLVLCLGKAFGLNIPEFYSILPEDVRDKMEKMRKRRNIEGYVLYYLKGNHTIGLAKVKTSWYVLLRALREKVTYTFAAKKAKECSLQDRIKATKKRFKEIQRWLKFSDQYLQQWENLGESFTLWLDKEIKAGRVSPKNLRPKFPSIWNEFLTKTQKSDELQFDVI